MEFIGIILSMLFIFMLGAFRFYVYERNRITDLVNSDKPIMTTEDGRVIYAVTKNTISKEI